MVRKGTLYAGILLVSAATLMFELALTRLFSVAEWYHFAFLSISVALLGYASSGTILSSISHHRRVRLASLLSVLFPLSIVGAYLAINTIPFDSYELALSPVQFLYLALYYLSLIVPFGISGYLIAHWMSLHPDRSNKLYAANLVGSALGTAGLTLTLPPLGGVGTVMAAASLGALGAGFLLRGESPLSLRKASHLSFYLAVVGLCIFWAIRPPSWAALRASPYKGLSYALQGAGARLDYQRWNVSSRVDVVLSPQIHSAPGLSLNYTGRLPLQHGLTVDGGDLSPISRRNAPEDTRFLDYLPSSMPHLLRPGATALIIQPRGGLDVAVALHHGARRVCIAEDNRLIVEAVRDVYGSFVGGLYIDPRVVVWIEDGRSILQQPGESFDIIQYALTEAYHPLTSASYGLSENYMYTEQAFTRALGRLTDDGLFVVTRWLQDPPSESVRAGALMVTALERAGIDDPGQHLLAFRSWSTMTLLASPAPFSEGDLSLLVSTCERLGYDLVYYPGMCIEEANQHNLLPQPLYYTAFQELLRSKDRRTFYEAQVYDISPPSDDHPFYGHYFRWRHIPRIVAGLGKVWQPFGGSGFLLVLALLIVAILSAVLFVLLPLVRSHGMPRQIPYRGRIVGYFAALGLGFLMVEMPLMQQFILYLGHPATSFIVVLSTLLLFSGVGSMLSRRISLRGALLALVVLILIYPQALRVLFDLTLAMALPARMAIAVVCLLPLGMLLGIPFAGGIRRIEEMVPGLTPWAWAINGSTSVVGSIAATILALSAGYHVVLYAAALCYLGAALAFWPLSRRIVSDLP